MICHEYQCVFVHVPKNAGQSVEHAFLSLLGLPWSAREALLLRKKKRGEPGPPRLAHLHAADYVPCRYLPQDRFDAYFKFSFVRNPWDRMISLYKYLGRPEAQDFKEFLLGEFRKTLWRDMYWFVGPQYEFLVDAEGRQLVDFVGRFETLQDDFNTVCHRIGLSETPLPHVNKSTVPQTPSGTGSVSAGTGSKPSYTAFYDSETQEFVADLYREDIRRFGYQFGG